MDAARAEPGAHGPELIRRELLTYSRGGQLLLRDLRRDLPLLLPSPSSPSEAEQRRARRLRGDLLSLLPFSFLVLNTVPLTPLVVPVLAKHIPRQWFLPSQFEEERQKPLRRLLSRRRCASCTYAARRAKSQAASRRSALGSSSGNLPPPKGWSSKEAVLRSRPVLLPRAQ